MVEEFLLFKENSKNRVKRDRTKQMRIYKRTYDLLKSFSFKQDINLINLLSFVVKTIDEKREEFEKILNESNVWKDKNAKEVRMDGYTYDILKSFNHTIIKVLDVATIFVIKEINKNI